MAKRVGPVARSERPERKRLPDTRRSITRKLKFTYAESDGSVREARLYAVVGFYEDGRPGELFIHMDRVGSLIHGLLDALAVTTSIGLQYGVPLSACVEKWRHTRFEPAGRGASSVIDLVASWLEQFVVGEER